MQELFHFYPRSPCGERLKAFRRASLAHRISIHALLAESDSLLHFRFFGFVISIHALLAESDLIISVLAFVIIVFLSTLSLRRATIPRSGTFRNTQNFYPRSPCGERLYIRPYRFHLLTISIHALLAESDLGMPKQLASTSYFYPRSPCGERRASLAHRE